MGWLFKRKAKKPIMVDEPAKKEATSSTTGGSSATKKITKSKKTTAKKTTANKKVSKKEPTNIYYVTMREEKGKKVGWEVKRGAASKVTAIVETKEAALDKVKELAKNAEATVMIYKADGKLQDTIKFSKK